MTEMEGGGGGFKERSNFLAFNRRNYTRAHHVAGIHVCLPAYTCSHRLIRKTKSSILA